jgi:hypothetical protein
LGVYILVILVYLKYRYLGCPQILDYPTNSYNGCIPFPRLEITKTVYFWCKLSNSVVTAENIFLGIYSVYE